MKLFFLLMISLCLNVLAYNQFEQPVSNNTLPKIVTIQVEGDVIVFLKNEVFSNNGENAPLVFSNVLTIVFSTFTISSKSVSSHLKLQRGLTINPQDTDSISVNGRKGYPDPDNKYWIFNLYDNGISLYSVHPTKYKIKHWFNSDSSGPPLEYSHVLYRFKNSVYKKVPYQLSLSNDNGLTRIMTRTKDCTLGDSLARIPRLYAEYENDPIAVLEIFGRIPESKKYSLESGLEVASLSRDILESSFSYPRREATKLMGLDSGNVVLHIKLANYYRKKGEIKEALHHAECAKQNSVFDDYLISYTEAQIFEKQKDFSTACQLYKMANEQTLLFTTGNAIIIRKKCENKIEKLSPKRNPNEMNFRGSSDENEDF